ncbi:MAG TPA: helix-turn-helix domain-containing protein [Candidatus Limnocylindria bacterium]|nr:helix-turn-helix domain-containing protein [Candidatus Limnocylindria bacterium]
MSASQRKLSEAQARSHRMLLDIGRELRNTRVQRGLSQAVVARAVRISPPQVSLIERGRYDRVKVIRLMEVASVLGLDLSLRFFPGGEPIRDAAHARLLERFRSLVGPQWTWAAEVPLLIPSDKRAWDRVLGGAGVRIGVEAETRATDLQEVQRRTALKKRDGGVDRLVLVLPDTDWCRRLVRLNDMTATYPVPGNVALAALAAGRDPGGDALILIGR